MAFRISAELGNLSKFRALGRGGGPARGEGALGALGGATLGGLGGATLNSPEFHTMPQGTGAQITKGDAKITAGETTYKTVDVNKGQNELIAEIKGLRKDINTGTGKTNRYLSELG